MIRLLKRTDFRAAMSQPDMPVSFLTGYSKGMLPENLSIDSGAGIIQKPVLHSVLLQKIRTGLDAQS